MSFDVITSQHTGDYMTFSMWANNKYINAVSVNGTAGYTLKYDQVRNCVKTTVTYDLTNVTDKSAIYFYFNPYCSHNDNSPFNAGFDNIQIGGDINTNCTAPTLTVKANGLSQITACKGDPVALTANPAGGENCSGSWEYTWYNGSNYWTGFSFNSSTEAWSSDFQNINISSIQSSANFTVEVRCDGDYSCTAQSSSFSVQVDDCIGINSAVDNSGIRIYSAQENVFTINLTGNNLQTEIFVYNITGRMVNNAVMQPNTSKVFNLSAYTKGVYYFSIINNKVRLTKRIIII
jgi:hypothetical protein